MTDQALHGHLDLLLLATLADGPRHGYAVIEELRRRSGEAFDLPEGTVYPRCTGWSGPDHSPVTGTRPPDDGGASTASPPGAGRHSAWSARRGSRSRRGSRRC